MAGDNERHGAIGSVSDYTLFLHLVSNDLIFEESRDK